MFAIVMVMLADGLTLFRQVFPSCKIFFDDDPFKCGKPVVVIALTRIVLAPLFSFF